MLVIVTALHCEAKPLIQHLRLKQTNTHGNYPIFATDDILLVVSGLGKIAAAAATGYCQGLLGQCGACVWLNVGVAGHPRESVGSGMLAHKLVDTATRRQWYPALIAEPPCPTAVVYTVDQVDDNYRHEGLVDMEATGFYETACRCSTVELVHCFKVVSDNPQFSSQQVSATYVSKLVEASWPTIDAVVDQLQALKITLPDSHAAYCKDDYDRILATGRFSAWQRQKLKKLLRRWWVLSPGKSPDLQELARHLSAREVLEQIEHQLNSVPISFQQ